MSMIVDLLMTIRFFVRIVGLLINCVSILGFLVNIGSSDPLRVHVALNCIIMFILCELVLRGYDRVLSLISRKLEKA